jgi:Ser/Thr protein kinase RdoA (MazF antagonist)
VNALGYANWPRTTVHGDWHPGNLIFRENADVAVVLDLDGTRFEPRATDIANGALQFSMRVDQSEPADWPASVDEVRLLAFCDGYDEFDEEFMLSAPEVRSLPHLMIEALIAESLGPIAATGRFGRFTGRAFLEVIERKSAWLVQHADRMTRILGD